ncbi:MAG: UvrD-helicase domain-containing protein [Verrucomicrobiota bacterium]
MGPDFDFVENQLPPSLSIIEASAGTGKTYAISHLVPRLLLEGTVSNLSEILLVTFTNDAARELSDRVRQVLQKLDSPATANEAQDAAGIHRLRQKFDSPRHAEILRKALRDIDMLAVSTIHSFCQRTLQSEGTLCGLPAIPELVPDATEFIEPELYDLWKSRIAPDETLAAIATHGRWALGDDIGFVSATLSLEDHETNPPARDFEKALEELHPTAALFDDVTCDELRELIEKVGSNWNKSAGDAEYRSEMIRCLREAKSLAHRGFLEAATAISELESWIGARSKVGKAQRAEAAGLKAVVEAQTLLGRLGALRWHWRNDCAAKLRVTAEASLRANRQITYDGLITSLRDALRSSNGPALASRLRARYQVALIDESQDTDPRQFEIFRNIFLGLPGEPALSSHRLVLIGDPKQAIYGFRGADVNTYLEAKRLAGNRIFRLNKTYRSCGPLVEAVNTFFVRAGSLLKEGLEFFPASSGLEHDLDLHLDGVPCKARVEVWLAPDAHQPEYSTNDKRLSRIAGAVASEIVRILSAKSALLVTTSTERPDPEHKPVRPGDFAVLVSAGYEAEAVAEALHARKVPAIVARGTDIMESEEAAELLTLLRAINEPRRAGLRFAALSTRLLGRDDAALRRISTDAALDDHYLLTFQRWQKVLESQGIAPALALIDREESISLRMARSALGERRVTNFRQLIDLLQAASMKLGRKPEHLLRWFRQEIAGAGTRSDSDERQQQLESDADAVQIVTMHAAKGLEWNLVFCPFLWPAKPPKGLQKISVTGQRTRLVDTDLASDPSVSALLHRNAIEDRLRLAYVAMTRAKVRLWIYGGEAAGKESPGALDWLLRELPSADFAQWQSHVGTDGRGTRHAAALEEMIRSCSGIRATLPPEPCDTVWEAETLDSSSALSSLPAAEIPVPWGVTSFSSLTREKHARGGADTAAPAPLSAADLTGAAASHGFLTAPGGPLMGTAIHDWIEAWDFSEPDPEAVERHLKRYEVSSEPNGAPLHEAVVAMLNELRCAELPGLDCTIAQACPFADASEWHFQLPIARWLSPQLLAKAFADHGDGPAQRYALLLGNLSGNEIQGFLQGFLDRLAFHGQTWGVIDWKTNKLGQTLESYGTASLLECAMHSHYLLQAHLYLVALRRYLGPDIPIAGAWLVFLRAVRAGTRDGILHIQPKPELLATLDSLFFNPVAFSCAK